MMRPVLILALAACASALCPNSCSGHGKCNAYDQCTCFKEGKSTYFGYLYDTAKGYDRIAADADEVLLSADSKSRIFAKGAFSQAQWTGADCSLMTCSRGVSWTAAHKSEMCLHADFVECSDQGICDRAAGVCTCFPGYEGAACQRTVCENDCSGHGICQSNVDFSNDASIADEGEDGKRTKFGRDKGYYNAWDSGMHYGCKCDLGYRGPDCSLHECPSSADPLGFYGNEMGEDCSGRGLCDYASGQCVCFSGYTGMDCSSVEALA